MSTFAKILRYFGLHIYTTRHLRVFVAKGVITAEQYQTITGETYPA